MKRSIYRPFLKKLELLFLLILIPVSVGFGQESLDVQKVFKEGEVLYQKRDFQGAIERYERILSENIVSPFLYYNLGSAYFRSGDIGKAILNYERALKLAPEDKEINHNLSLVRELLQDRVGAEEAPRWFQKLGKFHRLVPLNAVAAILSICYGLILLLSSYAIVRPLFRPRFLRVFLIPLASSFALFLGILTFKVMEPRLSPAIVTAKQLDVHYGPSIHETKAFVLHAGTKCAIRDISGEWVLIWLPNDRGGWVHEEGLERI